MNLFDKLAKKNNINISTYGEVVDYLIRQRYSLSSELAILRQRDEKPDEFESYYKYAEECKNKANEIINNQ